MTSRHPPDERHVALDRRRQLDRGLTNAAVLGLQRLDVGALGRTTVSGACGLVAIYVVSDSSLPPKVMMPACKKEMVCMFSSSFS